ncbi:unnamed protein product [Allacma fusca]|uniref:cholesterol 7-desaturase n=1 Tax=Allacma fusca TaxID=39272 RepID=A0A8J2JD00_9HEXA|nr:unnamed protein product [Allacma fusca]
MIFILTLIQNTWALSIPLFTNPVMLSSLVGIAFIFMYKIWAKWSRLPTSENITHSVGFESAKGKHKREVINRLQKQRDLGPIPPPYPNGWFILLGSEQLKKGTPTEVSVLGLHLLAWRGKSGQAYVTDEYSLHWGPDPYVERTVNKSKCLAYPIYRWQLHGRDGSFFEIPYSNAEVLEVSAKVHMHTIRERNGFIYLWHHAENQEPQWFPREHEKILSGQWTACHCHEMTIGAHIQDVRENLADVNHFNVVHAAGMFEGSLNFFSFKYQGKWTIMKDGITLKRNHMTSSIVHAVLMLFGKFSFLKSTLEFVEEGPGLSELHLEIWFIKAILFIHVTPLEAMTQRIVFQLYTSEWIPSLITRLLFLNSLNMVYRDAAIWNRKTYVKLPIIPKEDTSVKTFRLWFAQFYSENSPRAESKDSLVF